MSTVIIKPRTFDEVDAEIELVQLSILTRSEDWSGVFNQIELWRSKTTPSGPYEELTGDTWRPARVPRTAEEPASVAPTGPSVYIEGLGLNVRVDDEEDFVITFAGPDPVTYADAAAQVIAQGAGRITAAAWCRGRAASGVEQRCQHRVCRVAVVPDSETTPAVGNGGCRNEGVQVLFPLNHDSAVLARPH